jgi:DNA-binding NtrC family response regulator
MASVLMVEDEPRLRDLLGQALLNWSFSFSAARSGEEALRLCETASPDVLLLDLNLPGMDGLDTLANLRSRGVTAAAIILTGYGDLAAAQRAIELGVVAFLTKPFRLGELEKALAKAWKRPTPASAADDPPLTHRLDEIERQHILTVLEQQNGNRTATAKLLGISRRTLQYRLAEYGQPDHDED